MQLIIACNNEGAPFCRGITPAMSDFPSREPSGEWRRLLDPGLPSQLAPASVASDPSGFV